MSTYSHVEEYVGASGKPLDRSGAQMIREYRQQASDLYCRVSCRECLSACPDNVAVNDVLRYTMYFEHYGRQKAALGYYAGLEDERKPRNCSECAGPCEQACPYGLSVKSRFIHSHEILTP